MNLKHAVITSVNRDDLDDGGAGIFADTIRESRRRSPGTEIEVLIPDFKGDREALQTVMDAVPEVLNHNTETVLRLQRDIRTSASYGRSLSLLWRAKQMNPEGLTKSGLIVGMGETREEVLGALADMRAVGIDIITMANTSGPPPVTAPSTVTSTPTSSPSTRRSGRVWASPRRIRPSGPLQLSRQGEPGGGPGEHRLLKTPSTYGQMRSTPPESIKR